MFANQSQQKSVESHDFEDIETCCDGCAGCSGDCPWPLVQCQMGANGRLCSGQGRCLSTQGLCECFAPFGAHDCSLCADGYIASGGSCSRYVRIALPYIALQNRAASINVRPRFVIATKSFPKVFQTCCTDISSWLM